MTQQAAPAALRLSKLRAGATTPQHVIMELKQRILVALSKLADRDTQQIAVEELDKIVDALSPDCVSVCLSCLYDSEMQQKSVVKKECVRLFGLLASKHGDLIIPHLSKIIGSILRRLRDPDSSVRDACVDAMGTLSSCIVLPSLSSKSSPTQEGDAQSSPSSTSFSALTLATFSKPLLDALSEQNKSVQIGAAMCLARVIGSVRDPPLGAMSRTCPRICKFMSNPNFVARPALLSVIGSLSQVGALRQGQLTMVMPCVHEALENSDWATRKAAAETLGCISINSGQAVASFRQLTLSNLESCRFDKVKPVRDSVLDAIQLWKSLPGSEIQNLGSPSKQDSPESSINVVIQTPSPTGSENSHGPGERPKIRKKREVIADVRSSRLPKVSPEKLPGIVKKKIHAITDKKVNPDFFQKLSTARNTDDWDIKVAMPRKSPSPIIGTSEVVAKMIDSKGVAAEVLERSLSSEEQLFPGREMYNTGSGQWECLDNHNDGSPMLQDQSRQNFELDQVRTSNVFLPEKDVGDLDWEAFGLRNLPSVSVPQRSETLDEVVTVQSLQRQLSCLEQQQSSLLQIVQDFIASSNETTFALQGRVRLLEKVVEDLACNSDLPGGWKSNVMSGMMASGGNVKRSDFGNFWKNKEAASEHPNGRASTVQKNSNQVRADPAFDDWDEFPCRNPRIRLGGSNVFSSDLLSQQGSDFETSEIPRIGSEEFGVERSVTRRTWDKLAQPGLERHGEGPSARSVWQASKDEATLAAIRVAGEEEASEVSNEMSRLGSRRAVHTTGVQSKGQWSLSGSILQFVLSGDMESAYTEVLCMEDAMMLVRLMSRTGPVLDQLTDSTANELLHAVAQLLGQQNYHEICLSWVQQVADMVVSDGAESMDFSVDAKRELLLSLRETSATSMLDDALGTSVEQLFQLLMDAWSLNNEVSETRL